MQGLFIFKPTEIWSYDMKQKYAMLFHFGPFKHSIRASRTKDIKKCEILNPSSLKKQRLFSQKRTMVSPQRVWELRSLSLLVVPRTLFFKLIIKLKNNKKKKMCILCLLFFFKQRIKRWTLEVTNVMVLVPSSRTIIIKP